MITVRVLDSYPTWQALAAYQEAFNAWWDARSEFADYGEVSFLSVEALKDGLAEVTQ